MTTLLRTRGMDSIIEDMFGLAFNHNDFSFNKGYLKDMHPYDIVNDKENNKTLIAYQAVGIRKKDVKISKTREGGELYLVVEGKTHNKELNKDFSVSGKFLIGKPNELDKIKYKVEDGVIYVHLYHKEYKDDIKIEEI